MEKYVSICMGCTTSLEEALNLKRVGLCDVLLYETNNPMIS